MKILKKVLIGIVALVAIIAVLGFFIPRHATMERAIDIDTHAAPIYQMLVDPKLYNEWQPWASIDPEGTTYTYEGPKAGEGAKMSWESDHSDVGTGSQEWIKCVHNKSIRTELYFGGSEYPAYSNIVLDEFDGYTEVTWNFEGDFGPNPFTHYFTLFIEKMLGPQYETGLKNLKSVVEERFAADEELDIELEGDALVDSLQHLQQEANVEE